MRAFEDESGQMVVLVALCMIVLLGFMGMAIDVGLLFRAKRNMQIAADAAAVAGALDYKYNSSLLSAKKAGGDAATANGVTDGTDGAVVTINVPPADGPNTGADGYVEAIVSQPNPTFFMRMFHIDSVTVAARAVAGSGNTSGCIWALAKTGKDIALTGSGGISAPNCDIYDDSDTSDALTLTGSGSITAKGIGIVGGYSVKGSGSLSPNPPTTGIAPAADPLAGVQPPTIPTGTCSSNCNPSFSGSSSNTLNPGSYNNISNKGSGQLTLTPGDYIINGNLKNSGSGALILGAGNYTITGNLITSGSGAVTLGAGQYIIEGNLTLNGSGILTAKGDTFYTEGSTTVNGSGGMDLEAPTSGTYDGILFFQARGDTNPLSITGSGSTTFQGIVYAPSAPVTLTGSGSMSIATDFIADSISLTGSGTIADAGYSSVNSSSVLSRTAMVE